MLRVALALSLMAAPAAADFVPPAGCTAWLTVQSRSCLVSNHYRCDGDAPGDQWREDAGLNGPHYVGRIDAETQWLESYGSDGSTDRLDPAPRDPASFSTLIATGRDTYHFTTRNSTGYTETMQGVDTLTGESVMIDGVPLERTSFKIEARYGDGSLSYAARGSEYIHRDWRMFLSGTGQTDYGDGSGALPFDFTPVEFHFPGEPGFGDRVPKYDCDAMSAQLPGTPGLTPVASHPNWEMRDDL